MAYQNNRLDLPCFYYKNSEFTVQFRHMIIGGHDNQHLEEPLAILTSSSSGLRKLLSIKGKQMVENIFIFKTTNQQQPSLLGIEYSIVSSSNKVKISKNVNRLLAVERQAEEEGKEVVEGSKEKERTIGQEFQATVADGNVLGNDNSTMATIPTDNIVVANTDNTKPSFSSSAQSTQQPTGTVSIQFLGQEHIEKLFFFLLNEWREPRVDMRASRGLPQLISTGPFVNSTWKLIHVKTLYVILQKGRAEV